jgi:hypothetical protein
LADGVAPKRESALLGEDGHMQDVRTRWAGTFLTHGRGSRLITGQPLLPDIEEPEPPA